MINTIIKRFDELSTLELYRILQAREDVFILEQNCIYKDLDDIDLNATHFYLEVNKKILAYLRTYQKDEKTMMIGRVLTSIRGRGYGLKLLNTAIDYLKERGKRNFFLNSQLYAIGFYQKAGFQVCSSEYILDSIKHVDMFLNL